MKRLIDIVAAAFALVLLSPVIAAVALAILLLDGRPIFFRQRRPGLHAKPFEMIKFRTMTVSDDSDRIDAGTARITPLGAFLRRTSLDELPEFWNVLRGDMSLVGPRPLLMAYLPHYSAEQARRHDVRPGITGLAQVSGRNAISWEQKLGYDTRYVDTHTLMLDLRILFTTVMKVVRRADVDASEGETMQPFTGTANSKAGTGVER
ncbi:sugar transferase [Sphingomonas hylomeconis]|uniref:Sugar transferase n=1 Tax=Sphingomonas hylomeconis TaxID=1395958 RepID=A0ABV7SVS2_9SPHN|nr:sugar transferase [Sphingomonas hylomeconis]